MSARAPDGKKSARRGNAAQRILEGAARCLIDEGSAGLSMQLVADATGVSKGLIHYHFHDKESLLAALADWVTDRTLERERVMRSQLTPQGAVDSIWEWLAGEQDHGDVRILLELAHYRGAAVHAAVRHSAIVRRGAAAETVDALFDALSLRPRVPAVLLADVVVAFYDGIVASHASDPGRDARVAFDVFWLALLSLAE